MPSDWAAEVAGRIESSVAAVRANTVDRVAVLARLVVYGFVAVVTGLAALVLSVILAVRLLDTVLPRTVWLADAVLGLVFIAGGAILWSKGGSGVAADHARPRTLPPALPTSPAMPTSPALPTSTEAP